MDRGVQCLKPRNAIYHTGREKLAHLLETEVGVWNFRKVEVFYTEPPEESVIEYSGGIPESLSITGAEKRFLLC
ncbi:unnamed protein product [Orchesella dallaii]|uniref:Uncharacterized protein n=1 Tax=Orchesella dallaii TaxID=48710 RepID=A0ABP1R6D0_9HEXA